ncbi:MAG TPA: filamentous hemagglutinin N-terminal domain-containing protein, partial [Gammaproteobacteria bacterium]|nr:filamentous hemagglutinin N-terminal domain-containing protein [Gammaproteobacteria bacterium]
MISGSIGTDSRKYSLECVDGVSVDYSKKMNTKRNNHNEERDTQPGRHVRGTIKHCFVLVTGFLLSFCVTCMLANPQGGQVTAGTATISNPNGSTVQINQSTDKAVIDWQSYNIAAHEKTQYVQPSIRSITLNRIDPANGSSIISGMISANGRIILINPAGMLFTSTARVDVSGLIATTANLTNEDFMAGKFHFVQSPFWNGTIVNNGTITIRNEGLAALVAPGVENNGVIIAKMGKVVLGAGTEYTVDFYGDQMIQFGVNSEVSKPAMTADGRLLHAAVSNSGTIIANGGKVLLTAKTAGGILDNSINMSGRIEANTVAQRGGTIVLSGGGSGVVKVSGKMVAMGRHRGQQGGTVKVLGDNIQLVDNASINVSGKSGGGTILVGGNFHGAGPEQNARHTYVAPGVHLTANALSNGNGGNIAVWSDQGTQFYGTIAARGGSLGGNGGFVETSGKHVLDVNGASVDTRAPLGLTGNWLLDPSNIYVALNQANATTAGMSGTDTSANTASSGTFGASGAVQDSLLTTGNLTTALGSSNVIVTTTNASGTGTGNITVVDPITWATTNSLTLTAAAAINLNAAISDSAAGTLVLNATGAVTQNASGTIGGSLNLIQQGTGTTTLSQANTYSGTTTVNAGALTLSGAGTINASTGLTVNQGGTLTLDNSTTNNTNRLLDTAALTLNGGEFVFKGSNTAATNASETLGQLNLPLGASTVTMFSGTGGSTILTFASISRTAGATVLFRGDNLGTVQGTLDTNMIFTNPAGLNLVGATTSQTNKKIVPYAIGVQTNNGTGNSFVTYNILTGNQTGASTTGIRPLTLAGVNAEYDLNAFTAAGDNILLSTGTTNAPATNSYNSLLLGGGTLNFANNGRTETITSGAIAQNGAGNITTSVATSTIAVGAAQANIYVSGSLAFPSDLTGSAGVTVSGPGTTTFTTVPKTFSGGLTVNAGTATFSAVGLQGAQAITVRAPGTLNFTTAQGIIALTLESGSTAGATLGTGASTTLTLGADITEVLNGTGATGANISGTGTIALGATRQITVADGSAANDLTIAIPITGVGFGITKVGTGTLKLSNANTYTGLTTINNGTIAATVVGALGTAGGNNVSVTPSASSIATLDLSGLGATLTNPSAIFLNSSAAGSTAQLNTATVLTLANAITLTGTNNTIFSSTAGNTVTISGSIGGAGAAFTKAGAGILALSNTNNSYTGTTTIANGTLSPTVVGALGQAGGGVIAITPSAGSTAILDLTGLGANLTNPSSIQFNSSATNSTAQLSPSTTFTLTSPISLTGALNNVISVASSTATISGLISGSGGGFSKSGAGTLIISNASNSYTGATTVNAGTLSIPNTTAMSTSAATVLSGGALDLNFNNATFGNTNTITLSGTGVSSGGALTFSGNGITINNPITLGGTSTATSIKGNGTGTETFGGAITGGSGDSLTINLANASIALPAITLTGADLSVTSGAGAVNGSALLTIGTAGANNLTVSAATGINISNTSNLANSVSLTNSTSGNIIFRNNRNMTLTASSSVAGGTLSVINGTGTMTTNAISTGTGASNITLQTPGLLTVSSTLTAGGTGSISLTGTGITNNSTITGTTGGTTINAGVGGTLTNITGHTITNGGGTGSINLIADTVSFVSGSAGVITGGTGSVSLTSATPSALIAFGSGTSGGGLELSNTQLNTITTSGTFTLGDVAHTGPLSMDASWSVPNITANLVFQSGGGSISLGNSFTLVTPKNLTMSTTGGGATGGGVSGGSTLTVGPSGANTLTVNAGSGITLNSGGNQASIVNLTNSTANNISYTNSHAMTLTASNSASGGVLSVTNGTGAITTNAVSTNNGLIQLTSNSMVLTGGTLSAGSGGVSLTSFTPGTAITIGTGGTGLGLSNAALNTITTTGLLTIGDVAHTGTLTADAAVTGGANATGGWLFQTKGGTITLDNAVTTPGNLTLATTGGGTGTAAVNGAGALTIGTGGANSLTVNSGAGINLTNVSNLANSVTLTNSTSNNIIFDNNRSMTLTASNSVAGGTLSVINATGTLSTSGAVSTSTGASNIILQTAGLLTTGNAVSSAGTGSVSLTGTGVTNTSTVTGPGGITISAGTGTLNNSAGTLTNSSGSTAINLTADTMTLAGGTITGGSGNLNLTSSTLSRAITLGSGGTGLGLSNGALNTITTTGLLTIGDVAHTGTLSTDAAVTGGANATGGWLFQTSGGAITLNNNVTTPGNLTLATTGGGVGTASITGSGALTIGTGGANSLTVNSGAGINLSSSNLANAVTLTNSTSGNISFINSRNMTLTASNSVAGGTLSVINATGTLSTSGAISTSTGASNITLQTAGLLTLNNNVSSAGTGTVTLTGTGITNKATVTGSSSIFANAQTGTLDNTAGTFTESSGSQIQLTADTMSLAGGSIGGGVQVSLTSFTANRAITLGSGLTGLGLSNSALSTINTTNLLQIGDSAHTGTISTDAAVTGLTNVGGGFVLETRGGAITLNNDVTVPTGGVIFDTTNGGINTASVTGTGTVTVNPANSMLVNAGTGISLNTVASGVQLHNFASGDVVLNNNRSNSGISASNAAAGGKVTITNATGTLTVGNLTTSTGASDISAQTPGLLTINAVISSAGTGNISLTGAGVTVNSNTNASTSGNITVNAGANTLTLNSGSKLLTTGTINLTADTMSFDTSGTPSQIGGTGTGVGTAAAAILQPSTASRTIGIAGGTGSMQLTAAALNDVRSTNLRIGNSSAGNINLAAWTPAATVAASGVLTLQTGGTITQSGALNLGTDSAKLLLRDAGGATLNTNNVIGQLAASLGSGASLSVTNASGNPLTVASLTDDVGTVNGISAQGGATLVAPAAAITLNSTVTTSTGNIVLAGNQFINNAGASALNPGSGSFQVWSADPASDTRGGLSYNFKQYNATYGVTTVLGTGNGFLYTTAPTVTPVLTGTVSKVYNATTVATLAAGNYTNSGAIDGDTITFNNPTSGTYATANAGTGINVAVSGISLVGASNGAATVYGYQLGSSTANANIGTITQAPITISSNAGQSKIYGADDPNSAKTAYSVTAGTLYDTLTGNMGRVTGEDVGSYNFTQNTVTVSDGNSGNNYAITFNGSTNPFQITAKSLTASIANQTKVYGANDPLISGISVILGGVVNRSVTDINGNVTAINDTGNVATTLASLTRTAGEDV